MRTTSSGIRTIRFPFRLNIATIVNSNATSVIGLIFGIKRFSYHCAPFGAEQEDPGQQAGQERNPQIDEHRFGDFSHADVDDASRQPEDRRQHGDKDVGVDAEEEHLEDAVERHQTGRILAVTFGQLVPDDHHRDAAGQADQDQADHVFGIPAQEDDRQKQTSGSVR